jgi:hypothetical protein
MDFLAIVEHGCVLGTARWAVQYKKHSNQRFCTWSESVTFSEYTGDILNSSCVVTCSFIFKNSICFYTRKRYSYYFTKRNSRGLCYSYIVRLCHNRAILISILNLDMDHTTRGLLVIMSIFSQRVIYNKYTLISVLKHDSLLIPCYCRFCT